MSKPSTAEQLFNLLESAVDERISILEDEKKDAGDDDDINDQIAHWTAVKSEALRILEGR